MRAIASSLILTLPLFFAAGCDKKADDKKSDDKKADAKSSDDKQADAKPPEAPAEPELVMVEQDLTPAGADWAGWVAQGPEGAKVMGDLGKAARIAAGSRTSICSSCRPRPISPSPRRWSRRPTPTARP